MIQAYFHFYGYLNDFLASEQRDSWLQVTFSEHQSVKHLVETMHIPHTEIGLVVVNKLATSSSKLLHDGDWVSIYPPGYDLQGGIFSTENDLEQQGLKEYKELKTFFILDNHLGKLAVYLRMLGFDSWYRNDYQDQELACLTEQTGRILLTRDRGLLMRKQVRHGYCIRSLDPKMQLSEVLVRFDLLDEIHPFIRCLRCNYPLEPVPKAEVEHRLLPLTRKYYQEFFICRNCDQIYWQGSHFDRMADFIDQLRKNYQQVNV